MGLKMPFDFIRTAEALPAHGAAVRLLSRMNPHVHLQVSHLREALSTNLAAEGLFSGVAALVLLQPAGGAAAFPTNSTAVRFFARVHLYVYVQVTDVTKSLATDFATEGRHVALERGFLVRTVHGVGCLVAHVSGLSPVSSSSFGTQHLSVLHPDNIYVVFI